MRSPRGHRAEVLYAREAIEPRMLCASVVATNISDGLFFAF